MDEDLLTKVSSWQASVGTVKGALLRASPFVRERERESESESESESDVTP